MAAFALLFADNLRTWLRPRGLALLLAACLVPPGLTAAWVFTHQADVAVTTVSHDGGTPELDKLLNITATFTNELGQATAPFNATLQVGYFENRTGILSFRSVKDQEYQLPSLAAHASTSVTMNWTAEPGTYIFRAQADTDDALAEIEEKNNERYIQVYVPFPQVTPDFPARPPSNATLGLPQVDLRVKSIAWTGGLFASQANAFRIQVENAGPATAVNATLDLSIHEATPFGYQRTPSRTLTSTFTLGPGNGTELSLAWTPPRVGQYAFVGTAKAPAGTQDANSTNDVVVQEAFIDRQFLYQEPAPKATAREFYRETFSSLHLKILIPLIALFYAAGVIEDERNRGSLVHLLARPVPRWQVPVARFAAFTAVAAAAIVAGILVTYLLLLGLPQGAAGYLYWPMLFGVASLVSYGAVFTLLGVAVRRPYWAGLVYLLGIEGLLYLGRTVTVNGRPLVTDWVGNLSLTNWMLKAFKGWNPDAAGQWLPEGAEAGQGLLVMAIVAVAGLAGSAWLMRRRELLE